MPSRARQWVGGWLTLVVALAAAGLPAAEPPAAFAIRVVDADTGRGVPLVELRTLNNLVLVTDSAGVAAFAEPALMGQDVFFWVKSHGYESPKDGFGMRGVRLRPVPGKEATLKLKRLNVAERMYRVTGEGIYHDSVSLGRKVPLKEPRLNGKVIGQDSVFTTVYRDRLFWVWGDTVMPGYPLGNFGAAGATSELPGRGGLDPVDGVDLTYFTDKAGASRRMVPADAMNGPGPVWLGGLTTLTDPDGRERLIASYVRVENVFKPLERGLLAFDDEKGEFRPLTHYPHDVPLYLDGHPTRVEQGGVTYLYCGYAVPHRYRVRADWKSFQDLSAYEGITCLVPGARYAKERTKLERDADGRLVWGWKKDTPPLSPEQQQELVKVGVMREGEALAELRDVETGRSVQMHTGSVTWNPYRKRWVAIVGEIKAVKGIHMELGRTWYAEADTPSGPWAYARKVVDHDRYNFYGPTQHPAFDRDGGRRIYFEGTYTAEFSGNPEKTPRYDYNQVLYRLDLADPRLALPAPVYRVAGGLLLREGVEAGKLWGKVEGVAFFAVPPDRKRDGLVPVYSDGSGALTLRQAGKEGPLFLAASADDKAPGVVPLYEYRDGKAGRLYSTSPEPPAKGWSRTEEPVCRVWATPPGPVTFDRNAVDASGPPRKGENRPPRP